ncbi:type II secretion system protein E [Ferrovum sp. JA12]|uniref:type II secretion system ATPase GspE n=1 Tax=Ferrovum sp. JA12 TaxID=1356299 RepID=UPI0007163FDA|nr:type II secretion system ATPase GspE [Ferrovum sp. JA12]KRH78286.1 type II secretion system protein E [Ferrovum sp. JA12]
MSDEFSAMAARLLPYNFAKQHQVLVVSQAQGSLELWVNEKTSLDAITEIQRYFNEINITYQTEEVWQKAITEAYSTYAGSEAAQVVGEAEEEVDLSRLMQDIPAVEDILESRDDAPIIRMINALLSQASRQGASDIHIEPGEVSSVVRFRIDGTLRDVVRPKKALHGALVSRIKIMAQLDIAEKRLPQDGRIALRVAGKSVDIRVSTIPTGFGERVVLRLLDKEGGKLNLVHLGMAPDTLQQFDRLIQRPHGIVLVTGPTGSGKTTTLYAALSRLDHHSTNIMTVEDPIEYNIDGIGQTQVNAKIDMSFAKALRAILRQDPDVIMIGEIRDAETAQIAVQASLTGHLVLATLHTNDAVSAITRLIDMGVEPFLLSSSLIGVLGQRLVRKACTVCHGDIDRSNQCDHCGRTGYQGRTGIYELLLLDDEMRRLVHQQVSEDEVKQYALKQGLRTLKADGQRLITSGMTTEEELLRVTGSD